VINFITLTGNICHFTAVSQVYNTGIIVLNVMEDNLLEVTNTVDIILLQK
jgi:hypothetical protein